MVLNSANKIANEFEGTDEKDDWEYESIYLEIGPRSRLDHWRMDRSLSSIIKN
jgi:hypothetical protein